MGRLGRWVLWIGVGVALTACDGGTSPSQDPIVLQGTIPENGSTWTAFTLLDRHNVVYFHTREVTLTNGDPGVEPSLGIGLGQPDDDSCVTTFTTAQTEGGLLAFRLDGGEWCILIFDDGTIPAGGEASYVVEVEIES